MREISRRAFRRARERNRELRERLGIYRATVALLAIAVVALGGMAFARGEQVEGDEAVPLGRGLAGVAAAPVPPTGPGPAPRAASDRAPADETTSRSEAEGREIAGGEASYYASSLEGRATASGEAYRGARMTAAHRSLPLGSRLRVTNLANDRSVVVVVNDRGPFHGRRVIDVSRAAAEELGILAAGRGQVRLELLG